MFRLIFLFLSASVPALAVPSFDCGKAKSDTEKAICASRMASSLDADVAEAYRQALARLAEDPAAVAALREDQRVFIRFRDQYLKNESFDLEHYLSKRRDFLRSIDGRARDGAFGDWRSIWGETRIVRNGTGGVDVVSWTAQPATQSWTCGDPTESASGRVEGGIVLAGDSRYSVKGRLLIVEEPARRAGEKDQPGCGREGARAGALFPVAVSALGAAQTPAREKER